MYFMLTTIDTRRQISEKRNNKHVNDVFMCGVDIINRKFTCRSYLSIHCLPTEHTAFISRYAQQVVQLECINSILVFLSVWWSILLVVGACRSIACALNIRLCIPRYVQRACKWMSMWIQGSLQLRWVCPQSFNVNKRSNGRIWKLSKTEVANIMKWKNIYSHVSTEMKFQLPEHKCLPRQLWIVLVDTWTFYAFSCRGTN